jgi:hypothetical protein
VSATTDSLSVLHAEGEKTHLALDGDEERLARAQRLGHPKHFGDSTDPLPADLSNDVTTSELMAMGSATRRDR